MKMIAILDPESVITSRGSLNSPLTPFDRPWPTTAFCVGAKLTEGAELIEGRRLGPADGDADGAELIEGLPLGAPDGEADGISVGTSDGDSVGAPVGVFDGAGVGLGVGRRVNVSHSTLHVHGQALIRLYMSSSV